MITQVTRYTVCALSEGDDERDLFEVQVEYREHGLWAVIHCGRALDANGRWDDTPEKHCAQDDEWRASHLFPLERALFLAQQAAATVTVNGFTADGLVAWRRDPIRRARENGAASTPHLIDTPGAS